MVRDGDGEADQPVAGEGRLDDEEVGRVARAVERVVDEVDVARREASRRSLASSVRIAFGIEPSWSGIVTACAIVSPDGPQSAAEKSIASRTTAECAVRKTVVAISSASGRERVRRRCRTAMSPSCRACASRRRGHGRARARRLASRQTDPARRHDDRRVVLVDEERPVARARASESREQDPGTRPGRRRSPRGASRRGRCLGADSGAGRPARALTSRSARMSTGDRARAACRRAARARPRTARRARRAACVDLAGEVDRHAPALARGSGRRRALHLARPSPRCGAHLGVEPASSVEVGSRARRPGRSARRGTRRARSSSPTAEKSPRAAARSRCGRRAPPRAPPRGPGRSRRRRRATKSRGSRPFSVETARSARIIVAFARPWTPRAAARAADAASAASRAPRGDTRGRPSAIAALGM